MHSGTMIDAVRSLQFPILRHALDLPPTFLAPVLSSTARSQQHVNSTKRRSFTTSSLLHGHRYRQKDNNPNRGVSAIRRTGPKHELPVQALLRKRKQPLPEPIEPTPQETDPNHGLWGFFPSSKEPMVAPEDDNAHGRAWTDVELSNKSWEDLHRLHWVCVKERCRIATTDKERARLKAGYGEYEAEDRDATVQKTQRRIKQVLRTRWHSWNQARDLWAKGERGEVEEESLQEEEEEEVDDEVIPDPGEEQQNISANPTL